MSPEDLGIGLTLVDGQFLNKLVHQGLGCVGTVRHLSALLKIISSFQVTP